MNLPPTFRTDIGLTVEGAGPELLAELLREYELELGRHRPQNVAAMRPGSERALVEDQLESAGLVPAEELVVWWGWHDGLREDFFGGHPNRQLSLSQALKTRILEMEFEEQLLSSGQWIPITGQSGEGIAVRQMAETGLTIVRHFEPGWEFDPPPPPLDQTISLCTPVSWWIHALREGWCVFDPTVNARTPHGNWLRDATAYPMDWRLTEQV